MRTISREKFNELNNYLEYDGVDEVFLTKLHDATGILHTVFMMKMTIMWAIQTKIYTIF